MSYVINSCLLDIDYRKQHIFDLLDRYLNGDSLSEGSFVEWADRTLKRGWWFYGVEELPPETWTQGIRRRQKEIIALYEDIRDNGYNGSVISIYFDKKTGQVHTYDGFHRLSIIEFLGRSYDMNCEVSYHHPTREDMRGDFPLAERLIELNGGQTHLYQPCEDPRVHDWPVWRPDSEKRLEVVVRSLVDGSVLDVGCGSGYFSRQLARRGYHVTSLESNVLRLGVARYLATTQNLSIEHSSSRWQNHLASHCYDNVLMLSVLHHDILSRGVDQLWRDLSILRGRCKRLIVEFPLRAEDVVWLKPEQSRLWSYSLDEFTMKLMDVSGMDVVSVETVHPCRPILTLEKPI